MLDDQAAEGADIAERPAHDLGVGHRLQPVGEGERPALGQQAHLHEIAALQPWVTAA